jgi:hypothetical protein
MVGNMKRPALIKIATTGYFRMQLTDFRADVRFGLVRPGTTVYDRNRTAPASLSPSMGEALGSDFLARMARRK